MQKNNLSQKSTLKDIAKEAEVSATSVSLVLNDPETKRVSSLKRRQIIKIAEKLKYRPNCFARNLVAKESRTMGLVITTLTIPFYSEIAQDIIAQAKERGYSIIISTTREFISSEEMSRIQEERRSIYELLDRGVDGLIVCSALKRDPVISEVLGQGIPLVLALRDVEKSSNLPSFDYVGINNKKGGFLAAEHLLRMGHRRTGIITGDMNVLSSLDRLEGSLQAFKAYGVPPPPPERILSGNYKRADSYRATRILLARKERPTAILVHADYMAMGTLEALRDEGIKVPEEMAIVGFDDIEMAGIPGVDLTTVSQKKSALGRTAVDMLINRIRGQFNHKVKRILLEPTLVIRRTCGYPLSGERYGVHSQTQ